VAEIIEHFGRCQVALLTDYRGLSVKEMTALRRELQEAGAECRVVKNTLLRRALESIGAPIAEEHLIGPTALVFAADDPGAPAKVIAAFAKRRGVPTMKGGMIEGRVVGPEDAASLATLPGRPQLLAMMAACYQSPVASMVQTLYTLLANFAGTLQAFAEKRASAAA
jgi:large subunit ribosomal protein L10